MPTVKKENKVLTVPEEAIDAYLKDGYDLVEYDPKKKGLTIIQQAVGGRRVSLSEFNRVLKENENLKTENMKLHDTLQKLNK